MRYLCFVLALLGGISFGAVAYAGPNGPGGGDKGNGEHGGDCHSDAAVDSTLPDLCDD